MVLNVKKLNNFMFYAALFSILYIPKVNIIEFSFSYVGAKPEDIIFVLLSGYILAILYLFKSRRLLDVYPVKWMALFILCNIIFLIINDVKIKNVAFIARYIEYFIFFWYGMILYSNKVKIEKNKTIANMLFVAFWVWLLACFATGWSIEGRKASIFAHPSEFAGMVIFATWVYMGMNDNKIKKIIIFILACVMIILSETRSAIIGMALVAIINNPRKIIHIKYISVLLITLACGMALYLNNDDISNESKFSRLESVVESNTLEIAYDNFLLADPKLFADGGIDNEVDADDGDLSLNVRLFKWGAAVAYVSQSMFIVGIGAGNLGEAMDGFYIRVLGENGIIGLYFYLMSIACLFKCGKYSQLGKYACLGTLGLLLEACFIDVFYFSRIAIIFWFIWGGILSSDRFNNARSEG